MTRDPLRGARTGRAARRPLPATVDEPRPERLVVRDVATGEWRLEVDPRYGGTRVYPDGLEFTEDALETYTITRTTRCRPGPLRVEVRLNRPELAGRPARTRSDRLRRADFIAFNEVRCPDGNEVVFHRTWEKRIPRTAG